MYHNFNPRILVPFLKVIGRIQLISDTVTLNKKTNIACKINLFIRKFWCIENRLYIFLEKIPHPKNIDHRVISTQQPAVKFSLKLRLFIPTKLFQLTSTCIKTPQLIHQTKLRYHHHIPSTPIERCHRTKLISQPIQKQPVIGKFSNRSHIPFFCTPFVSHLSRFYNNLRSRPQKILAFQSWNSSVIIRLRLKISLNSQT